MTFHTLEKRPRRLAELMLPATNLEKYLGRLTVSVVVFSIAFFLTLIAADIIRLMLYTLCGWEVKSIALYFFPEWWDSICEGLTFRRLYDVGNLGTTYIIYAFFLLGSTVFRRFAFVKTASIGFLLILLLAFCIKANCLDGVYIDIYMNSTSWFFALLFTGLSYRVFKRIPVIPRKRFCL